MYAVLAEKGSATPGLGMLGITMTTIIVASGSPKQAPGSCTYADCCSSATKTEFSYRYRNWASNERRQVEFLINHALYSIGRMVGGKYGMKRLKANTLQQIAGKVQAGVGSIMDDGIYQQDIAECHTTDSVRAWFKEHQGSVYRSSVSRKLT
ncbi:hypothetical protein TNCV_2024601 [Trichonephila clavipes]|nr:hypothetical protein TNCV_2024601 [Trichonephila clavipes]